MEIRVYNFTKEKEMLLEDGIGFVLGAESSCKFSSLVVSFANIGRRTLINGEKKIILSGCFIEIYPKEEDVYDEERLAKNLIAFLRRIKEEDVEIVFFSEVSVYF